MLFRKKIPRSCGYCTYGTKIDENMLLCVKRGVVSPEGSCRKFSYDPCKRIPVKPKALDLDKYKNEDYSL